MQSKSVSSSQVRKTAPSEQSFRDRINDLSSNSQSLPRPVVIGFLAFLLLVGAFATYRFLSPASPPVAKASNVSDKTELPDMQWLRGKITQTSGDYNQLPQVDRAKAEFVAQKNTGMSALSLFPNTQVQARPSAGERQARRAEDAWLASRKK